MSVPEITIPAMSSCLVVNINVVSPVLVILSPPKGDNDSLVEAL